MAQRKVICFETKTRGAVKPPYAVNYDGVYWLLKKVSPNVRNCGVYERVSEGVFIRRGKYR